VPRTRPLTPGQRIRAWRRLSGKTLDWLAGETGISRSELSRFENEQQPPEAAEVERIASAFGLSMPKFYGEPLDGEARE
jgi:transcriptional regulator with XRE-family HTH domain